MLETFWVTIRLLKALTYINAVCSTAEMLYVSAWYAEAFDYETAKAQAL